MKVWFFVEGESDKLALGELLGAWRSKLRGDGKGIEIIPLQDKARFFKKIGTHAAAKLVSNTQDCVVAIPDLYPNADYANTRYRHNGLADLKAVLLKEVRNSLAGRLPVGGSALDACLERFHASALKHDLEMLLLAAHGELGRLLGTNSGLGNWRHPVEDQDQDRPPKKVIEDLFRRHLRSRYRDTVDAPTILRGVADISGIIRNPHGQVECPVFKAMLDWAGLKTGIPVCD